MATTVEILEALVAFDTTSRNSNLALIDFVEDYLSAYSIPAMRLPDATGTKASLIARIGPDRPGGIVLSGHTDTVPVEGQPWTRPPFSLTEDGDRLYGRGTTDMKGFLASVLAVVPCLRDAQLQRPIVLAFSHDEELGCRGVADLARNLVASQAVPGLVVVGEPTSMAVVRAHKGVRVLRTTVRGRSGHSSRPELGASAILAAARVVGCIDEQARWLADDGVQDSSFEPPMTTINVGTIRGGEALNIIAPECELVWEYRCVPGQNSDEVLAAVEDLIESNVLGELRQLAPEASVTTEIVADVPALEAHANSQGADLLKALGLEPSQLGVSFGTDGSAFAAHGLATVICGPGSMAQGHQPDEYIDVTELDACDLFLRRLSHWASA